MATLREVQLVQLEIAKEVKCICEKYDILYFLDAGSLLGAIRHKGFIPWDDDLDIAFLREDYEKFIAIVQTELSSQYELQTWKNDEFYPHPFAKIRKKGTVYIEASSGNKQEMNGVFIDLFPYDLLPNTRYERKWLGRKIIIYKSLIRAKTGYKPWKNLRFGNTKADVFKSYLKYLPLRLVSKIIKKSYLIIKYEKLAVKYNDKKECTHMYPQGATKFGSWNIPRECFNDFEELPFEDTTFSCISEWDLYLSLAYGDYMKLPPERERGDYHKIVDIKL